tara:strand:+ start:1230 stop:3116 length:1887 start_codon:yes stop_codon:yes gene_type:complete
MTGHSGQIEQIVPLFGYKPSEWPQMKLFLNVMYDNYVNSMPTNSVSYDGSRVIPELNGEFYEGGTPGEFSDEFRAAQAEIVAFLAERKITATGINGSPATGGKAFTVDTAGVTEAYKTISSVAWFGKFMETVAKKTPEKTDASTGAVTPETWEFKTASDIYNALQIAASGPTLSGRPANEGEWLDMSSVTATAGESTTIKFKWTKYTLKEYLEAIYSSATKTSESKFFEETAEFDTLYFRKPGDSNLYYKKPDGSHVSVTDPEEIKKIQMGANCFDTGYTAGSEKCYDLVAGCLAGKDVKKCKEALTSTNWNDQINDLSIDMIKRQLSSFGVQVIEVEVEGHGPLKQFQSFPEYIKTLKDNFSTGTTVAPADEFKFKDSDIEALAKNSYLEKWITLNVNKINRNPAVLNPSYTGTELVVNPNAFAGTKLAKYGLAPKATKSSKAPSIASIIALQNAIKEKRSAIAVYYGIPITTVGYTMTGGAYAHEYFEALQDPATTPLLLSELIEKQFNSFITTLKAANKDLEAGDKESITKMISDLKTTESKLLKSAIYTSKYNDLVSVHSETDSKGVISLDHLKKFVDNRNSYFEKTTKKQDSLMSIVKSMVEAIAKEAPKEESKTAAMYPSIQ